MPTDSNGNYTLPSSYEAVTGETIEAAQHNEPFEDVAAGLTARVMRSGVAPMTGNLNMDSHRITNVTDPSSAQDAATKAYVDGIALNVGKRSRVRVATTANITISTALNSGDTLDGVTLADGDLVLVKDQSSAAQNGVYTVASSPARTPEFDTYNEIPGSLIAVQEGTANADTLWICTSNEGGTLDSTAIAFSQVKYNAATTTLAGVVELATDAETQTGTDTDRAVTPSNLSARTATDSRTGLVELATDAEVVTGTDTARAVTPANIGGAWTTYTPTITAVSGTFTSVAGAGRYKRIGKTVHISITVTITTNGNAATAVIATLPANSVNARFVFAGRETQSTGHALNGAIDGGSPDRVSIAKYDNTYPGADGRTLVITGTYEAA